MDALRVAVLVLDADDHPVLANPPAREMGLLRGGVGNGGMVVHTVIRTLAGQARRTGTRREVELDLPRGNGRDPLGIHIRAVALGDVERCAPQSLLERIGGEDYLVRGEVRDVEDGAVVLDLGDRLVRVVLDGHQNPVGHQQAAQVRARLVD